MISKASAVSDIAIREDDGTDPYDSRRIYEGAVLLGKRLDENGNSFLPSPDEIQQRMKDMFWLQRRGIDDRLIRSAMMHNLPPPSELVDAVREGLSPSEVWHRFRRNMKRRGKD